MITINLETQTMFVNKNPVIKNGKPIDNYKISTDEITFPLLEELYQTYKHSMPDNIRYKYNYFRTLSYNELEPIDLITSQNRQKAKHALEYAILTGSLNGSLVWPDDNKWFWQSTNDPDFVILKKWVKPEDEKTKGME